MNTSKAYLGDGAYVELEHGKIVLTTSNGVRLRLAAKVYGAACAEAGRLI